MAPPNKGRSPSAERFSFSTKFTQIPVSLPTTYFPEARSHPGLWDMRIYLGVGKAAGTSRQRALGDGETEAAGAHEASGRSRPVGSQYSAFSSAQSSTWSFPQLPTSILMSGVMGLEEACSIMTSVELPGKRPSVTPVTKRKQRFLCLLVSWWWRIHYVPEAGIQPGRELTEKCKQGQQGQMHCCLLEAPGKAPF